MPIATGRIISFGDSAKAKISIKGLFQARYTFSSVKAIDLAGLHHTDGKAVDNGFDIKRARIQFLSRISDRTEVVLLLNLADFKSDPKNKVLENAYLTYRLNRYLHFKIGQFRPAFGLEDAYPVDIIKSLDYSNQYTLFGTNGWQSFQVGASAFGEISGRLPVKYELTVVNGNNRNPVADNDNGKHYSSRVEFGILKRFDFRLGLNGGIASIAGTPIYASGLDVTGTIPIAGKMTLELQAEAKLGINHVRFAGRDSSHRLEGIEGYAMRGIYVLPNLRYAIDYKRLSSLELSCRYECLDADFRHGVNPKQTWTPMISAEFLKSYNARIQFGMVIDRYTSNIPATTQYNNAMFIFQVQSRL